MAIFVTPEAIWQYFSPVTLELVKIISESPHSKKSLFTVANSLYHVYRENDAHAVASKKLCFI